MDNLAYLLLAIGTILLVAEIFLPTGGVCFLLAALCAMASVALLFFYGKTTEGLIALFSVFVGVPILLWSLFYLWPDAMWGNRLIPKPDDDTTVASMPANLLLEQLRNRIGRTVSPLRPSGIVEFDGKRIDCVSEGMLIDPGQTVRCIDVRAGRVVVRQIDKPNLNELENTDFG